MAKLRMLTLECVKKQELFAKDRVNIFLNNILDSGPHIMGKGDELTLGGVKQFKGTIEIKLEEDDAKNDEVLGTHRVNESESGTGKKDAVFNIKPGFDYHMKYEVVA